MNAAHSFPKLWGCECSASIVTVLFNLFPPHLTSHVISKACLSSCTWAVSWVTDLNMSYQNYMNLPQFTSDLVLIFGQIAQILGNAVPLLNLTCFSLLKCCFFFPVKLFVPCSNLSNTFTFVRLGLNFFLYIALLHQHDFISIFHFISTTLMKYLLFS